MSEETNHRGVLLGYTLVGFFAGLAFPAFAAILLFVFDVDRLTLFYIISSAPVVLGFAGYLLGTREQRRRVLDSELEQRVADRTGAVQSMLDVTGDGFLTFGPDLLVQPQYSKPCERIFGTDITGKRIDSLLYESEQARLDFEDGLAL